MAELDQDVGGKNSSKILIIIIIILLLIIAGGVAYFMLAGVQSMGGNDDGQLLETKQQALSESDEEFVYYEVEQPLRVNFPKGASASLIEVKVAFLLEHEDDEEIVEKHEPMIINNLLMAISAAGADALKTTAGKNELRATMLTETRQVMTKMNGKDTVREVFFTAFVMQ